MIVLIVEKSLAYVDYVKVKYLDKWGCPVGEVKNIEKLDEAGGQTLFGDSVPSIITVSTPAQVKSLVKDLETAVKKDELDSYSNSGLIIVANIARVSTKKLEKIVADSGGVVEVIEKNENIAKKLLSSIKVSKEVKQFLTDYVGDNYETLIPVVKALQKSSVEVQRKVSVEAVYLRLPKQPGAVPPWEVENALMKNDFNEVVEVFRRVDRSSSFLVVLSMLKNKFMIAYRIAALLDENPGMKDSDITKILGIANNYYYKKIKEISVKYGVKKLEEIVQLLTETEANVKGGVNLPGALQMEITLIKLNKLLK